MGPGWWSRVPGRWSWCTPRVRTSPITHYPGYTHPTHHYPGYTGRDAAWHPWGSPGSFWLQRVGQNPCLFHEKTENGSFFVFFHENYGKWVTFLSTFCLRVTSNPRYDHFLLKSDPFLLKLSIFYWKVADFTENIDILLKSSGFDDNLLHFRNQRWLAHGF